MQKNNMTMQKNKQKGFTLIELVIVIVILGILSAFALPRFANLGADARASTAQGAFGAVRSATAIVRSACLASADCNENEESGESITVEGETIDLAYGYPTQASILVAAQVEDDFDTSTAGEIRVLGAPNDGDACLITYEDATGPNQRPTIEIDVSEC